MLSLLQLPLISHLLKFERNYNQTHPLLWIRDNWTFTIWLSAVYAAFLVIGTAYMKNRAPFDLRLSLGLWSLFLSLFSLAGSVRLLSELNHSISRKGFHHSYCQGDWNRDPRISFWMLAFTWSKVFELVDTVFIVLRKQKLIFLHWYHHILTLIYCFFLMSRGTHGPFRWFATMNFSIHTLMYAYYSIKALRLFHVPSVVNKVITTSQILQMVVGFSINVVLFVMQFTHPKQCDLPMDSNLFGLILYSSFLLLFVKFFNQSYGRKEGSKDSNFIDKNHVNNNNHVEYEWKKSK